MKKITIIATAMCAVCAPAIGAGAPTGSAATANPVEYVNPLSGTLSSY